MKNEEMEQLITDYGRDVYRFCIHLTGNIDLAEDLYQDTFVKLLQRKHRKEPDENIKSYLMGIAVNLWRNRLRKEHRRAEIMPLADYKEVEYSLTGFADSPLNEYLNKEMQEDICKAVHALPEKQRITVLLYYGEEFSVKEIAQMLHIPKGTVLSRLANARRQLKEDLEGYHYAEG